MKNKRWLLQVFWAGEWRDIMQSDERHVLAKYMQSCPDDLEVRIVDTQEGVKARDRRD